MKKILKANQKRFIAHLEAWIKTQPQIKKRESGKRYEYETMSIFDTELFFSIDRDNSFCYTVFMRFDDPKKVGDQLSQRMSPYTGKYNFHLTLDNPIEAAEFIIQELEELTDLITN